MSMNQIDKNQRLLSWLESEKRKDDIVEKVHKDKLVREIKKLKKEDIFTKKEKLTIWQKIKRILLGI